MLVFTFKQYPENFAFFILRSYLAVKFVDFLKVG